MNNPYEFVVICTVFGLTTYAVAIRPLARGLFFATMAVTTRLWSARYYGPFWVPVLAWFKVFGEVVWKDWHGRYPTLKSYWLVRPSPILSKQTIMGMREAAKEGVIYCKPRSGMGVGHVSVD